jgi:hypothetical protein
MQRKMYALLEVGVAFSFTLLLIVTVSTSSLGVWERRVTAPYIQSRLNAAFGRPFRFYGVPWGWGLVVGAFLFGLMHLLNLGSLTSGDWHPAWWWGVWTFFSGLVFGFVREKTDSIFVPTLFHGLPQAIAYAVLGW